MKAREIVGTARVYLSEIPGSKRRRVVDVTLYVQGNKTLWKVLYRVGISRSFGVCGGFDSKTSARAASKRVLEGLVEGRMILLRSGRRVHISPANYLI